MKNTLTSRRKSRLPISTFSIEYLEAESDEVPQVENSSSTDNFRLSSFEQLVRDFIIARGVVRRSLFDRLIEAIKMDAQPANAAAWAAFLILDCKKPGRVDTSVDLLTALGLPMISTMISDAVKRITEDEKDSIWKSDFWYALFRSAGRAALQRNINLAELLTPALSVPLQSVREAVVECLAESGDATSLECLVNVEKTDPSPFIRLLASEVLEDTKL